jgi:hypothetical protein
MISIVTVTYCLVRYLSTSTVEPDGSWCGSCGAFRVIIVRLHMLYTSKVTSHIIPMIMSKTFIFRSAKIFLGFTLSLYFSFLREGYIWRHSVRSSFSLVTLNQIKLCPPRLYAKDIPINTNITSAVWRMYEAKATLQACNSEFCYCCSNRNWISMKIFG